MEGGCIGPQMDHADNMCAVFTHHLPSADKGFVHWGRVFARTGDRLTIKWQTDKEPQDCNMAYVYQDEKPARAAAKGTALVDAQPMVVKLRPMLNIGKEQFLVPETYGGNLQYDETMCSYIFACNLSRRKLY